jgi:hypothetical protein
VDKQSDKQADKQADKRHATPADKRHATPRHAPANKRHASEQTPRHASGHSVCWFLGAGEAKQPSHQLGQACETSYNVFFKLECVFLEVKLLRSGVAEGLWQGI